jgi:hypothetical protein
LTDDLSEAVGSIQTFGRKYEGSTKNNSSHLIGKILRVEAPSGVMELFTSGFNAHMKNQRQYLRQVSADSVQKSPLESSNSTISTDLSAQKPLIARAPFNGRNIPVEAPSRGNGMSLPGGIQRQQEEPSAVIGDRISADTAQKSPLESSNSTISTDLSAQKPLIARAPFNGRNIPVEAPQSSAASNTYPAGIQRLETTGVKEQEESTESLQMQPQGQFRPSLVPAHHKKKKSKPGISSNKTNRWRTGG